MNAGMAKSSRSVYCLEEDSYSQDRGGPSWRAMLKDVRAAEAHASHSG